MTNKKNHVEYGYYSKLLKEPFDSIEDLKAAEAAYNAKMKAKEQKDPAFNSWQFYRIKKYKKQPYPVLEDITG